MIKKMIVKMRELPIVDILLLSVVVFAIKLLLSFLPSFSVDMGAWLAWAHRMNALGPLNFYSDEVWTQYTPGFLYYLWVLGKFDLTTEFWVKLPTIVADIMAGLLIYKMVLPKKRLAIAAFVLYTLNPVIVFDGSVWGQIDGILSFFMLFGVYCIVQKKNAVLAGVSLAIAFLLKPQAAAILPAVAILSLSLFSVKKIATAIFCALGTILFFYLPFFPDPLFGIFNLIDKMTGYYAYTSVFAFNVWSWVGFWKSDAETFLGVAYSGWGIFFYLLSAITILVFYLLKKKKVVGEKYLLVALFLFASFLFPTRVHERYILPVFAFFLPSLFLLRSKFLLLFYVILSALSFLNIYYPYAYYVDNWLRIPWLVDFIGKAAGAIGLGMVVIFFGIILKEKLIPFLRRLANRLCKIKFKKPVIRDKINKNNEKRLILAILVFSVAIRLFRLGIPEKDYFDEIYHAFTARQMLSGDSRPWHWSSAHPEGFAYEWTHPPLAKEIMAMSMGVFGVNSFAWRLPGALLGAIIVFVVYLIAKKMFGSRDIAILAAFVISLDGLLLTMSRIGTADIYFVAFAFISYYLFLQKRDFSSALFLGLAAASKWSTFWILPVFGLTFIFLQRREVRRSLLWFFVIPPIVYLVSYLPMFTFGHNLETFWGMQKQMWWYHSKLEATHPYTSPWWSWPLMYRPVYLHQNYLGGSVENIYALGNPFFFWFGGVSLIVSAVLSIRKRMASLFLIVVGYGILFAPWAFSPRIMFLYHYLPALPFMAISLSVVLKKYSWLFLPVAFVLAISFVYFFPHWTAIEVSETFDKTYYWFPSWR